MHFPLIALRANGILFPFFLSLCNTVVTSDILRRGPSCSGDLDDSEGPDTSGTTTDFSPGIGFELESLEVAFVSPSTTDKSVADNLKGKSVKGHSGKLWNLTVDTFGSEVNYLDAEYILSGKLIALGSGQARQAASEVVNDITTWDPVNGDPISIDTSSVNDWEVDQPHQKGGVGDIKWAPQVTTPMPLEAISDLFVQAATGSDVTNGKPSYLLAPPDSRKRQTYVAVTKDFFQSSPNGISSTSVTSDVLGFFSLVLSYVKQAQAEGASVRWNWSPKFTVSIMPRTDFVTLYNEVKAAMNAKSGSLYDLVKVLACYKNNGGSVVIDTDYCEGTVSAPQPKSKMDSLIFQAKSGDPDMDEDPETDQCTVQDWIKSIESGPAPDRLTVLDRVIDSSIGSYGDRMEYIKGTQTKVPLFEFRDLAQIKVPGFPDMVTNAENEVVGLHGKYASAPQMVRPRYVRQKLDAKYPFIKRGNDSDACVPAAVTGVSSTASASITTAPPMSSCSLQNEDPDQGINTQACICGSTTLPLLTVTSATDDSQSCSYTALPSSTVSNPVSVASQTWTTNCQACTLVGGIADTPSCTTVASCTTTPNAKPTLAVNLSNTTVQVGDVDVKDGGSYLRKTMYNSLRALCPDDATACTSTTDGDIDHIESLAGDDQPDQGRLNFAINGSYYNSPRERDQMLTAAVTTWERAVNQSCKAVPYRGVPYPAEQGSCTTGEVQKREYSPRGSILKGRSPERENPCAFNAHLCVGPGLITMEMGSTDSPYTNHMMITIDWVLDETPPSAVEKFICEAIIETLSAAAIAAAPELAGLDIYSDIDLISKCDEDGPPDD